MDTTEQGFFTRLFSLLKIDPARIVSPYLIRGTAHYPAPKWARMPRVIRSIRPEHTKAKQPPPQPQALLPGYGGGFSWTASVKVTLIALTLVLATPTARAADAGEAIPLGKLVKVFLTAPSTQPAWSMGATDDTPQINWDTVGVSSASTRAATARVSVGGDELQNLRQRLEPVVWQLRLSSSADPKFGPETLSIEPDCDTVSCYFDAKSELLAAGVSLELLCDVQVLGYRQTAYRLSHEGRHAIAVVTDHEGSAGPSTDLTLFLKVQPGPVDYCADARAEQLPPQRPR